MTGTGRTYGDAYELLPPGKYRSEEWHSERRWRVGASDLPAICDVNPPNWATRFSLYWSKVEDLRTEANPDMDRGSRLEEVVADMWLEKPASATGDWGTVARPGMLVNSAADYAMCDPDMLISPADYGDDMELAAWIPVECKTSRSWDDWGDEGTGEVPLHYRLQLLWQCRVIGAPYGYIACMLPSHEVRSYRIDVDHDELFRLNNAAVTFIDQLTARVPPPLTGAAADLSVLKRATRPEEGRSAEVPAQLVVDLAHYRAAARDYTKLAKQTEAKLRAALVDAKYGVDHTGEILVTRTVRPIDGYTVKPFDKDTITVTKPKGEQK